MFKAITSVAVLFVIATAMPAMALEHTVKRGETLESIAAQYGVTVEAIRAANPNAKLIVTGIKLEIPEKSQNDDALPMAQTTDKGNEIGTAAAVAPIALSTQPKQNKSNGIGYLGLMMHGDFENSVYKHGGLIGVEVGAAYDKWHHFGLAFSMGTYLHWDPFEANPFFVIQLGPCYGRRIAPMVDVFVPVKLSCALNDTSEADRYAEELAEYGIEADTPSSTTWGCMINPTVMFGTDFKIAVGLYALIQKETSYGLTLGLVWSI